MQTTPTGAAPRTRLAHALPLSTDAAYAARCLEKAISLFAYASKYEGKYSDFYTSETSVYPSSGFLDDLAFAVS